jgi:hypothetical protein
MRFFLLIIVIVLTSSCRISKKNQNFIEGNWYTSSLEKGVEKELQFAYQELYLSKNKIFCFDNYSGFKMPSYYKVKDDSLFLSFFSNKDFEFLSKIIYTDDKFSLVNKKDSLHFFRLKNVKNTLDKFIIFKDSIFDFEQQGTGFSQGFIDRYEEYVLNLKNK